MLYTDLLIFHEQSLTSFKLFAQFSYQTTRHHHKSVCLPFWLKETLPLNMQFKNSQNF